MGVVSGCLRFMRGVSGFDESEGCFDPGGRLRETAGVIRVASDAAAAATVFVIDETGPLTGRGLLAEVAERVAAAEGVGGRGEVWLVGGGRLSAAAAEAGLTGPRVRRVAAAAGGSWWALPRLRRLIAGQPAATRWEVWSLAAAAALRGAGVADRAGDENNAAARGPIRLHLQTLPTEDAVRRLDHRGLSRVTAVFSSRGLADAWLEAGLAAEAVEVETPVLPGFSDFVYPMSNPEHDVEPKTAEAASNSRTRLRQRWGLEAPDAPVILLLADVPGQGDVGPAMLAVSLTAEATGREPVLLVHPEQHGRRRAQAVLDRLGVGHRLRQEPWAETPWKLLAGVDAALLGEVPAPRSTAAALAAGVAVVGPDRRWHRDLLPGDAANGLAPTAEPKKLADRLHHVALKLPRLPPRETAAAHGPMRV